MAFPYLNEKLALLEKTSKWNQLFLKKYQKLFISQIFFFVSASCAAILSSNWKKTIPYQRYPKFKQWKYLIIQLQPR